MKLSDEEVQFLIEGCQTKICLIETGEPHITARDAENSDQKHLIRALDRDQMALILKLHALLDKLKELQNARSDARSRRQISENNAALRLRSELRHRQ